MTLNELRKARAKLHDRNKELLEVFAKAVGDRPGKITDEQINDEFETNEQQIAELDEKITAAEVWEDRRSAVTARDERLEQSDGTAAPTAPAGPIGVHTETRSSNWQERVRRQYFGSLTHIQGVRNEMSPEERAYRLGMWGMHVATTTLPHRFRFPNATRFCNEQGMIVHSEGSSDTSGAHLLVPAEFRMDLIDLKESRGVVRRLFGRVPMMRDTLTIPRRASGLTAYAVGENDAGTESSMGLNDINLTAKKWMVISRMSKEFDEDTAVSFGDILAGEIAYAFSDKEDEAGINGDGTSTYHNIVGVRTRLQDVDGAGTNSAGLTTGAGNLYSELTLANFETVAGNLPLYADTPSTVWICHKVFYFTVMKRLELASGGVSAMEVSTGNNARRPRPLFLGYPVEFSQVMPSSEANSQVCCLFGDFNQGAKFGDRRQDEIEFDDTVVIGGQSVWERDQIAVKGTERMDINVHEYGSSSAAGSIVGLETAAA